MDLSKPVLQPQSLFPPNVAELFPEHQPNVYEDSFTGVINHNHTGEPVRSNLSGLVPFTNVPCESHRPVTCRRCLFQSCESFNWCSSCGELLIGASLCSSDSSYCNSVNVPLCSTPASTTESSPPDWCSVIASHNPGTYLISHPIVENNAQLSDRGVYAHRATSTLSRNSPSMTTSFTVAHSFGPPLTESRTNEADCPITWTQCSNMGYHLVEASSPSLVTSYDALQPAFNNLMLQSEPLLSEKVSQYMKTDAQDYSSAHRGPSEGTLLQTAFSYPDSGKRNPFCMVQSNRQRCVSGPVRAFERNHFPEQRQVELNIPVYNPESCHSPLLFSSNEFEPEVPQYSSYMTNFWFAPSTQLPESECPINFLNQDCLRNGSETAKGFTKFQCPLQAQDSQPTQRRPQWNDNRFNTGIDYRRRKNSLECSKRLFCSKDVIPVSATVPHNRSRSSDLHLFTSRNSQQEAVKTPGLHWQPSHPVGSVYCHTSSKKCNGHTVGNAFAETNRMQKQSQWPGRGNPLSVDCLPPPLSLIGQSGVEQGKLCSSSENPDDPDLWVMDGYEQHRVGRRTKVHSANVRQQSSNSLYQTAPAGHLEVSKVNATESEITSCEQLRHPNLDDATQDDHSVEAAGLLPETCISFPTWELLPDELWLTVMRFLPRNDRASLALVCRRLSNLIKDRSLWRAIRLHRHQHLTDTALACIGRLRPREFRLTYCHGDGLCEESLRLMFKSLGTHLRKLSFIGCTKGLFDCDLTLLLAAKYCPNLCHVNASYTQVVRDNTVVALAKSTRHLVSVKLNGAQHISNSAIQTLVHYHKDTLQRLELFGCFRLNSDIFALLGQCQQLRALAFGHLHHLSSDGLLELVGKLPLLASLDLRGTQTLANETNLTLLADKCPHLEEVVLANMHSLKHEADVAQMLRRLPRLRVLDLCGLAAVGDMTMEALASGCPQLEELDVSCTSVTQEGLSYLAQTPAKCLRCLRISLCREITKEVLEKLVESCPKLTLLHAYGFKSIKDWNFLRRIRPNLLIESEG